MQASAPQYQPYQPQPQQFQQFQHGAGSGTGSAYLSGAVTAPGYPSPARPPQLSSPRPGTTSSQPLGAPHHVPWRGAKAVALTALLVLAVLETANFITSMNAYITSKHSWLSLSRLAASMIYISITPNLWWLFFAFRRLFRNQPVSEMTGLALWFGFVAVMLPTGTAQSHQVHINAVIIVISFFVATVGAVATTRLNQRLKEPRSWILTLAVGSCQFILFNTILRFMNFGWISYILTSESDSQSITHYTSHLWLVWSDSNGVGIPLVPALILSTLIAIVSGISVIQAARGSYGKTFKITSITCASLLSLDSLFVSTVFGGPSADGHSHTPSETGFMLLAVIVVGIITVGSTVAAARHLTNKESTGGAQQGLHAGGAPGMQNRFSRYHRSQSPRTGGY
nr:annexin A7 [Actinomyces oris]